MQNNTKKNSTTSQIIKVSDETKKEILNDVENNYKNDVREMIFGKTCWRRTGITFETLSKVTIAIGGVLSFSSGYFNSNILSFVSGSVSVISLALLQFGTFGFSQSKRRANDLNILLKKLELDTVPVFEHDIETYTNGNKKTERKVNLNLELNNSNSEQYFENKHNNNEDNKKSNSIFFKTIENQKNIEIINIDTQDTNDLEIKDTNNLKKNDTVDTQNIDIVIENLTPVANKNVVIMENNI
jgi:hypothetical protein